MLGRTARHRVEDASGIDVRGIARADVEADRWITRSFYGSQTGEIRESIGVEVEPARIEIATDEQVACVAERHQQLLVIFHQRSSAALARFPERQIPPGSIAEPDHAGIRT